MKPLLLICLVMVGGCDVEPRLKKYIVNGEEVLCSDILRGTYGARLRYCTNGKVYEYVNNLVELQ